MDLGVFFLLLRWLRPREGETRPENSAADFSSQLCDWFVIQWKEKSMHNNEDRDEQSQSVVFEMGSLELERAFEPLQILSLSSGSFHL